MPHPKRATTRAPRAAVASRTIPTRVGRATGGRSLPAQASATAKARAKGQQGAAKRNRKAPPANPTVIRLSGTRTKAKLAAQKRTDRRRRG